MRYERAIFTIDLPGEGEVIWNVASISYFVELGHIPGPFKADMSTLPLPDWSTGNLDRGKVDLFKRTPRVLVIPAIGIQAPPRGDGLMHILCFCDGSHRLTARQELGMPDYSFYIVPYPDERRFRMSADDFLRPPSPRKATA